MPKTLATTSYALLLAGAALAGLSAHPAWAILVIAALATVSRVYDPRTRLIRTREGRSLLQVLPGMVLNQLIWVNLAFLVGLGISRLFGALPLPVLLPLVVSALGLTAGLVLAAMSSRNGR
ncbi:hypothetical protein C8N32_108104 [Rhodovulum imhoffii]|uniref:Uncharacterized protein n=1 Tax=Rhodovulum imhoffii TaxID=365340 RepID=A0A2T5BS59_9RHOB|nr:hypothetical protein [Rhodovulum imhoffii]MBK5934728.1 hypothetical protein [Rhodovulum imhoffii]PTN02152.1 hypothetical protein C8N32_108104 [Rhodovulum imhoffii]